MNSNSDNSRSNSRDPEGIAFARLQRATANEFAQKVWQVLRNRGCRGEKFRREYSIPPYTVDFCCVALKLIVEVDGQHHLTAEGEQHDQRSDHFLTELGCQVLRIKGYEVIRDLSGVIERIENAIDERVEELGSDSR